MNEMVINRWDSVNGGFTRTFRINTDLTETRIQERLDDFHERTGIELYQCTPEEQKAWEADSCVS